MEKRVRANGVDTKKPFEEIKKGEVFFHKGKPIVCGEDSHCSGDSSYDGYLLYDENGYSWFPEDLDAE